MMNNLAAIYSEIYFIQYFNFPVSYFDNLSIASLASVNVLSSSKALR